MQNAALLDEPGRISALRRLDILDSPPEVPFENIVALVRTALAVPIAAVTLVDSERQWFKAMRGLATRQTPRSVSFCAHAVQQCSPFVVNNAALDSRFAENPLVTGDPRIRSYAGAPLTTRDGYNLGALCAIDTKARSFSTSEISMLTDLARIVVNELELRCIAQKDELTGACTRRGLVESAQEEIERYKRYGRPASLMVLDIDRFKLINDTYGHPGGDEVLRQLSIKLRSLIRPFDVFGRLGGEEFGILLPETDAAAAVMTANRFRSAIESMAIEMPDCKVSITASIGIAPLHPGVSCAEHWLAAADTPLYVAKRSGRNRCELGAVMPFTSSRPGR